MYNKTIIRFGFCDIQSNQGLGVAVRVISFSLRLQLITPTSTDLGLDYSGYHKDLIQ